MTTNVVSGAVGAGTLSPIGYALPAGVGLQLLHFLTSQYEITNGTQFKNLAYAGAPASLISGTPTVTSSGLTVNVGNRDFLTASPSIVDSGGDATFYFVFKNLDTLATNQNSPCLMGNYGTQPGEGSEPAGTSGFQVFMVSTTTIDFIDGTIISGSTTPNIRTNTFTDANLNSGYRFVAFTVSSSTVGSVTTVKWTFYDQTGGVTQTFSTTNSIGRAPNQALPFVFLTSSNAVHYGLCACAFIAFAQTAVAGGGAHTAAQISTNYAAIKAAMAALPTPIIC